MRTSDWSSDVCSSDLAFLLSLLLLDFAFPPKLPEARDTSTVVVARDGTPLRAFADAKGVWRYPADPDAVSSLYLQTLLNYRSEEHTSELQSLMRISYAVFCLKKKTTMSRDT